MKKAILAIASTLTVLALLAGCGNKIKGTDTYAPAGGEVVAAVTNEDGDIKREDDGKIVVAVTNESGEAITDHAGEVATVAVEITHAITLGDRIECGRFSIEIPKGWVSPSSNNFDTVTIDSKNIDKTGNKIVIYSRDDENSTAPADNLLGLILAAVKVEKSETSKTTIAGVDAEVKKYKISSDKIDYKLITLYTFESGDSKFEVLCYSNSADTSAKTFEEVLNTMTLY